MRLIVRNEIEGRSVHVINTHGIGDVVMMVPFVAEILINKPKELSFTLKSQLESEVLQLFFPESSFKYVFMRPSGKKNISISRFGFYIKELRNLSPGIIFTVYGVDAIKSSIVSYLSGAFIRVGWKSKIDFLNTLSRDPLSGMHKVNKNMNLIECKVNASPPYLYSFFKTDAVIRNEIRDDLLDKGVSVGDNYLVAIAPGSGMLELHKRWSAKKYRDLVNLCSDLKTLKFILVGDKSESLLADQIITGNVGDNVIDYVGMMSITKTVHLLSLCDLALCNCNGISHLAAATGISVIGMYGPTNPYMTGPYSDKFEPVSLHYNCSPCYRKGFIQGCADPNCMRDISVSLVYDILMKFFYGDIVK